MLKPRGRSVCRNALASCAMLRRWQPAPRPATRTVRCTRTVCTAPVDDVDPSALTNPGGLRDTTTHASTHVAVARRSMQQYHGPGAEGVALPYYTRAASGTQRSSIARGLETHCNREEAGMSGLRRYPIDGTPYHIQVHVPPLTRASLWSSQALIEAEPCTAWPKP